MGTFLDYLNEIENNPNFFKQKKVLTESSFSRLWKHHMEHPCGTISAFRNEYTKQENLERTEQLRLRIGVCGYSFTKIQGKYIETNDDGTKKNVSEISFIVYDLFDQEDSLLDDLLRWVNFLIKILSLLQEHVKIFIFMELQDALVQIQNIIKRGD